LPPFMDIVDTLGIFIVLYRHFEGNEYLTCSLPQPVPPYFLVA
jgi:hypothetical protein